MDGSRINYSDAACCDLLLKQILSIFVTPVPNLEITRTDFSFALHLCLLSFLSLLQGMCAANLIVFGLRLINQTCQFCYMLNISMWKTQREEDLISVAALFLK